MKDQIQDLVLAALQSLQQQDVITAEVGAEDIAITRTKDASHGDWACNVAMRFAKPAGMNPRELAQQIIDSLPASAIIEKVAIAGPGFINFFVTSAASLSVMETILAQGDNFGRSQFGQGKSVQVEFVSANPTGPLHVGHGRGAAYGATVADLLEAIGFDVHREYYVNDAGRQMDILGTSVWLRYLELRGESFTFPSNGYKGDYVFDIAATLDRTHGDQFHRPISEVFDGATADEADGGDKEQHIDDLIANAKRLLGAEAYLRVFNLGLETILGDIRDDLARFGVHYQTWYSERSLVEKGAVQKAVDRLQAAGHLYEKEGALWFRSTDFGDEKDRVVRRENGIYTYFASDIAYHAEKLERGFDRVIDIWGADHHGYIPRVRAALKALGDDDSKLDVLLVQFAILYRSGERIQMSTRSGQFVTLRELRKEVGQDAARFFYVMRRSEQHMDFDLDLAKSQTNDNPVYYIQYAHARICSVLRQAEEKAISVGSPDYTALVESHETDLVTKLATYPEVLKSAAMAAEPHQLVYFLRELANLFHTYYNAHQFLVDDVQVRDARLALCQATRQVLRNGLALLGVSAPEQM